MMGIRDLSHRVLADYRLWERLGSGTSAAVYRATHRPSGREVALKVLDPTVDFGPNLVERLQAQTRTLASLGHPGILPVHEVGSADGLTFLAMRLVRGGSLAARLAAGPMEPELALVLLGEVAGGLEAAHRAGLLHLDLRPANILFDADGSALLADFGLARIRFGYVVGTPGYLAPEQALGLALDTRTDVYGLALVAFEVLTGTPAFGPGSPTELVLAAANDPPPSARARNPRLPQRVAEALRRGLARDPGRRPSTPTALVEELSRACAPEGGEGMLGAEGLVRPARPGQGDAAVAELTLTAVVEGSPEPVVAVDPTGAVEALNSRAEALFGWAAGELAGRPLVGTLVAPTHREMLDHLVSAILSGDPRAVEGHAVQVVGLRRDGHTVPIEMSFALLPWGIGARLLASCRDLSPSREAEKLLAMQDAISDVLSETSRPDEVVPRVLEAIGSSLDWQVGLAWQAVGEELRCRHFWAAPGIGTEDLRAESRRSRYLSGQGPLGRAWAAGEPLWQHLAGLEPESRQAAAARAGMRWVGTFPIHDGDAVLGMLEFLGREGEGPSDRQVQEVAGVGRRLGRLLREAWGPQQAERRRYRIDTRNTHLGFSCAFMRFMTVHGLFKDFSGWVDLEDDDPTTARAECRIRTASVDTGSMDRDYHLCSPDFFDVETYPEMVFTTTSVEPRKDGRFRVVGDLTIRNTTRPVRLDVRLEDRETDASGAERVTLTASTVINRLDWFMDWEKALQAGRWLVGEQVRLDLVIALIRRPGEG